MITWLKFWCIHASSWFSSDHPLVWPFLLHLSLPTYHPFLESHEWDFQWDICLGSWTFSWRFHHRILKILALQMFPFFDDLGLLRFLLWSSFLSSWMRSHTRYAPSTWISWAIFAMLLYSRIYFYLCIFVLLINATSTWVSRTLWTLCY